MDEDEAARREALLGLIELRRPVSEAAAFVARLPWDSDTAIVMLSPVHAYRMLYAVAEGSVSAAEAELWAERLECRDDVVPVPGDEELLRRFLFEVSTPELNGALTETWRPTKTRSTGVPALSCGWTRRASRRQNVGGARNSGSRVRSSPRPAPRQAPST